MTRKIEELLPTISEQNIKAVNISSVTIDGYTKDEVLYSLADQSDLIIFTEGMISDEKLSFYFDVVKNVSLLEQYSNEAEQFLIGEKVLGVKIFGNGHNNASRFYSGNQTCWIVFGYKSPNLKTLNGVGEDENDAALQILKWLTGE